MKNLLHSLLPLSLLLTPTFSLPTSQDFPPFPITDLLDSDLTIEEYADQLSSRGLTKRQYNGDTYNQLTDGSACREISLIFARGTTSPGNVGAAGSEGPTFFNALASRLGGTSRLAIQGVNYSASVLGFLQGGDPAGSTTTYNLINDVAARCPSTKIVLSGYSQGAQLVHNAAQRLSTSAAARINAVVTFGDADRDEGFGPIAASKILIICHDGDNICDNGIIITPAHSNYEIDAPAAADFVVARV
ncbi:carbohydrate esterase family 5 protein [Lentithecium fluviatile CBS 122367]|uniref:Cutinase n=1 Tax=Lentithecium fluviatile CBS 122367 TaxID=1168545 RepID=A0A6G1J6Z9_9PLEO|nr:carbohydrate esterase family 5 protein [Lentithecium fluviatile CBS 122367]